MINLQPAATWQLIAGEQECHKTGPICIHGCRSRLIQLYQIWLGARHLSKQYMLRIVRPDLADKLVVCLAFSTKIGPSQSDSDWWDELKVFCSVWHIFRFLSRTLDVECQNTYALHSIHTHMRLMCWWWSSSGNWKITHIFNQKRVKSWQKDHRH